jgi:hypothetical protein
MMSFKQFRQDVALFLAITIIIIFEIIKWPFRRNKNAND